MVKQLSQLDQAIQSQLNVMEHFLHDMITNVNEAQNHITAGERYSAMGALLHCEEAVGHFRTFYDAIFAMHRNADIIERNEK